MTIICAVRVGSDTWIGSDTRAILGGGCIMPTQVRKWAVTSDAAIGGNGDLLTVQLFKLHADTILAPGQPHEIAARAFDLLKPLMSAKHDADGGAVSWGNSFIIAMRDGIFDIDAAFATTRIPDGVLWARGSGRDYALGASHAIGTAYPIRARIEAALQAACAFDYGCGGDLFIHRLGDPLPC